MRIRIINRHSCYNQKAYLSTNSAVDKRFGTSTALKSYDTKPPALIVVHYYRCTIVRAEDLAILKTLTVHGWNPHS